MDEGGQNISNIKFQQRSLLFFYRIMHKNKKKWCSKMKFNLRPILPLCFRILDTRWPRWTKYLLKLMKTINVVTFAQAEFNLLHQKFLIDISDTNKISEIKILFSASSSHPVHPFPYFGIIAQFLFILYILHRSLSLWDICKNLSVIINKF